MATLHHNFSGSSGAITRELLAAGDNARINSISIANLQGTNKCQVDLWVEKKLTGKFYFFKGVHIPKDMALIHNISLDNSSDGFSLHVKLTPAASTILVDIILS